MSPSDCNKTGDDCKINVPDLIDKLVDVLDGSKEKRSPPLQVDEHFNRKIYDG